MYPVVAFFKLLDQVKNKLLKQFNVISWLIITTIEGFPAKRAYITFRADFYFCRI